MKIQQSIKDLFLLYQKSITKMNSWQWISNYGSRVINDFEIVGINQCYNPNTVAV